MSLINFNRVFGERRGFDDLIFPPVAYRSTFPNLDMHENENEAHVKLDLPGMKKEDLNISIDDNVLTVEGHRNSEANETGSTYSYSERSFGSFKRSVMLPRNIDSNKVSAIYENGVLHVHAPKVMSANRTTNIPIR